MDRKDLHNNIEVRKALSNTAIGSNTTTVGDTIDTKGYGAIEFVPISDTITDGSYAVQIFEGDASNMSDEVQVAAADLIGTAPTFVSTDDNAVKRIGVKKGTKRYMRMKIVSTGVTTGGAMQGVVILGNPDVAPTP